MDSTLDLPGNHTGDDSTLAGGVKGRSTQTRRNGAITLWLIGFIALVVATIMVIFHPAPWPFDLQTTITLQHTHRLPETFTVSTYDRPILQV